MKIKEFKIKSLNGYNISVRTYLPTENIKEIIIAFKIIKSDMIFLFLLNKTPPFYFKFFIAININYNFSRIKTLLLIIHFKSQFLTFNFRLLIIFCLGFLR